MIDWYRGEDETGVLIYRLVFDGTGIVILFLPTEKGCSGLVYMYRHLLSWHGV
jgi:hypothetical protein